jgi:hypothetical protein
VDVQIPEKLLFDMIDLLVEPQSLRPDQGVCVLSLEARNRVLDRLLSIRHQFLFDTPSASRQPAAKT